MPLFTMKEMEEKLTLPQQRKEKNCLMGAHLVDTESTK